MSRTSAIPKSKALAKPGDPLITSTGAIVEPDEDVKDEVNPAPSSSTKLSPATFKASQRRALAELPGESKILNAVAVIFLYTALGVSDREIIEATKLSTVELKQVRNHIAYTTCFDLIINEFINANSELLVSRIAAYSHMALDNVANLARKAKGEKVKLDASTDLLDRAGVRPKDNENRTILNKNELRIVIDGGTAGVALELNGERIGG